MSRITAAVDAWTFNRERTLATLDRIAACGDPASALSWRPGPHRAHAAWQLMHIAVTEELFATVRLERGEPHSPQLVERYQGGSTPQDSGIPGVEEIRDVLTSCRAHLIETVLSLTEDDLERIPEPLRQRGWTIGRVLNVLTWHEAHHQGQAHLALNLWENRPEA